MNKAIPVIVTATILLVSIGFGDAFADKRAKHISLEDVGVLQLAAHDLFNVNRCKDISGDIIPGCIVQDLENGKLDLSTLLLQDVHNGVAFSDELILLGGEPRNRENIMLFTVASEYGAKYLDWKESYNEQVAKQKLLEHYHEQLSKTFERTFGEEFPKPAQGDATHTENLALRTIHDFLPDKIKVDNQWVSTLDFSLHGKTLDQKELRQKSSKLDGKFDDGFRNIDICFPPDFAICVVVDLLKADSSFAEQFDTDYSFEYFLEELEDGRYDSDDKVFKYINNLMAKGQSFS